MFIYTFVFVFVFAFAFAFVIILLKIELNTMHQLMVRHPTRLFVHVCKQDA